MTKAKMWEEYKLVVFEGTDRTFSGRASKQHDHIDHGMKSGNGSSHALRASDSGETGKS